MILDETYVLSNGVTIPKIGLGTWMIEDDKAAQIVRDATAIGYRYFDTAEGYGNERGVGEGIRSCGIARDRLFVTTKLEAAYKTYAEAKDGIDGSLKTLGSVPINLIKMAPEIARICKEGSEKRTGDPVKLADNAD